MNCLDTYRSRVFPLLAGGAWITFLFLDVTNRADSTWVKFAAICLCGITALLGARTADGRLVAAALCFTVAADWFLLVLNDRYLAGVGLFLIAQGLYAVRIYRLRGSRPCPWGLAARAVLLFLCAAFAAAEPSLLPLWAALLYFSNLCINTAEAFALGKSQRIFAMGLLLFVCCDVCVGGWNISLFLPPALAESARVGMWLFYLPSQVLIVLSQEQEKRSFDEKTV